MSLSWLSVRHVRNVAAAELSPKASWNVIFGRNGSGKTTLLEAIHVLGLARSFRTHDIAAVVQKGERALQVVGKLSRAGGQQHTVGVERGRGLTRARLDGKDVGNVVELAGELPLQVITPDIHNLLTGGPRNRRRYLDWGVFHVEPTFLGLWKGFHRALQQRNAALRGHQSERLVRLWDEGLVEGAESIHAQRRRYLAALVPVLTRFVGRLLEGELQVDLQPGWPRDRSYAEVLAQGLEDDRRIGRTRHGPQRANLSIKVDGKSAEDALSRGEQKLLVSAMQLAQVAQLDDETRARSAILVDDLPAELDAERRSRLLGLLHDVGAQVFVTTIEPEALDSTQAFRPALFHVEHGQVREVL
ncbi:MAG: hypothetical protein AMJ69_05475 [Gammaproteobacteria bacterium SG8_47]|nr:MAG: hypothetical protein AMJ69_05475 [Gammaproteobacteria bacterium SG8_47]